MSFSKVLLAALSITAVNAKPLPSKVARAPAPSSYPLGDSCGNEWKYLNFDPANEADQRLLRQLHDVICIGEVRALASRGYTAAEEAKTGTNAVFNLFFDTEDDEDETPNEVGDALRMIRGDDSSSASFIGPVVGEMVVDNKNFSEDLSCDNEGQLAYTENDEKDGLEKIHFCPIAYEKPNLESIDCGALDSYPSMKMDTFSRVVLHEITHGSNVGPKSALAARIIDVPNEDGEPAYDISRAHALVEEDPGKETINADNYAFMSLDAWVSWQCTPRENRDAWASFFPDPPPAYE